MTPSFHDFVLCARWRPHSDSRFDRSDAQEACDFGGIEPAPNGVTFPHRRIPSSHLPNQILTFGPCPRKLPKTQKQTAQTE
jgi:hypothetical protein